MKYSLIDTRNKRDPGVMGALSNGVLQILPVEFWAPFTQEEIGLFCLRNGLYCLPTLELVNWLREHIAGRKAIEIGAGNGVLAKAVGIKATDSYMQAIPRVAALYTAAGQALVNYGDNVERLDAESAILRYSPEVVVGAWITHRYNPAENWREGNAYGPEENYIIERAEYVNIGHTKVHAAKPVMGRIHSLFLPDWLRSRALSEGHNYIAVWKKGALWQ